jgi:hypothetical protein
VTAVVVIKEQVKPRKYILHQLALGGVGPVQPQRVDPPELILFHPLFLSFHGVVTVMAGVIVIWITPPYAHISLLVLFSSGFPATRTVGAPGVHGAGVTGTQGMGVSTPSAAAVAEATLGFARLEHIPKLGGLLSMIVAWSIPVVMTVCCDVTIRGQGAAPKEHMQIVV